MLSVIRIRETFILVYPILTGPPGESIASISIRTSNYGTSGISSERDTQVWIEVCKLDFESWCAETRQFDHLDKGSEVSVTESANPTRAFSVRLPEK